MGYYIDIVKLKKKSLEKWQDIFPNCTFSELYSNFLFSYIDPDEYDIPDDEIGVCFASAECNIFHDYFNPPLETNDAFIIDKDTYNKMCEWLETKLKSKSLYDLAIDENYNENEFIQLIRIYKQMSKENIDFETEIVVYVH